ncbi:XRE family transcriptional regulator [Mycobacteroides abscessus subsp. abscessus]|jgi:hypothetical protein|uniref:XRE family transcriptional regulator n=1 Tax=Mycobacteroides abscessus TaxID=36809 RepID=UPI00266D5948|nr:XRE family transcriptional regulator [Mycobacteroides abscessus]MDO3013277.1 XRE family transcriptional regulator [Mycobacteroides abscessus subsp. abscessus]
MAGTGGVAARINRLFDVMHKRAEPPLSTSAAAAAITAETGVPLSADVLARLRAGQGAIPTDAELVAVAQFFGVSARYLVSTGPHPDIEAQLNLLEAMRDAGVHELGVCGEAPFGPNELNTMAALIQRTSNKHV